MWKRVFGQAERKGPDQIAHPRVWSDPLLSANWINECFNGVQMPGWDFAPVQDSMNPHILSMLEDMFFAWRGSIISTPSDILFKVYDITKTLLLKYTENGETFQIKKSDIFHIPAQT